MRGDARLPRHAVDDPLDLWTPGWARGLGSANLAAWARARAAHLAAPAEEVRPYQRYGGVLGRS